jgi:hypothetical protein
LLKCEERVLVFQYCLLDLASAFHTEDTLIIYLPLARESETAELVSDSEALLSSHDAEGVVILVLVFFIVAKHLFWEHAFPVCLREYCVATDVLRRVEGKTITLH